MMKRWFFAAAVVLVAVACGQNGKKPGAAPEPVQFLPDDVLEVKTVDLEYSGPVYGEYTLELNLNFDYVIDERLPQEVRDSINATIVGYICGIDEATTKPEVAGEKLRQSVIDEYTGEGEIMSEDDWDFGTDGEWYLATGFEDKSVELFRNYVVFFSEYHYGAAHGYHCDNILVFDLTTGRQVTESDLFIAGYERPLTNLLTKHLLEDSDGEVLDMLLEDEACPNGNFMLTPEGITYTYNPYSLCAYAAGIVDISVPWSELRPLLRTPYANRLP